METSMNMVAAPELVKLERLGEKTFPTQPAPDVGDVVTTVDWTARHPEMAVGEPQKASADKGERILTAWAEGVVRSLRRIKKDEIVPRAIRDYNRQARDPNG
jgi:creatinine amidohydrolase/Fe(II)-dependent formamide hydrolase-like protein